MITKEYGMKFVLFEEQWINLHFVVRIIFEDSGVNFDMHDGETLYFIDVEKESYANLTKAFNEV